MKKIKLIFLAFLTSCIGAGTHGSIKRYEYPVTKKELEKAVNRALQNSSTVSRQALGDYYNNGDYLTINIKTSDYDNEYIFRYYGDSALWENSPTSEIFICYAYDKDHNGGSEGKIDSDIENKLTSVFEKEFVSKLDSLLNQKHIEK